MDHYTYCEYLFVKNVFSFFQRPVGCGRHQPRFRRHGFELIVELEGVNEDSQEKKLPLTAERVCEIFKGITDEEVEILRMNAKFSRPEWMLVTTIPVLPLPVRPAVMATGCAINQVSLLSYLSQQLLFVGVNNTAKRDG